MRSLLLVLVLVSVLASPRGEAAPAPFPRAVRPRDWSPVGEWVLEWRGPDTTFAVTLTPAGEWRCGQWVGSWAWDARTRTLQVREECGRTSYDFAVRLDHTLSGTACWGTVTYGDGGTGDLAGLHVRLRK